MCRFTSRIALHSAYTFEELGRLDLDLRFLSVVSLLPNFHLDIIQRSQDAYATCVDGRAFCAQQDDRPYIVLQDQD